MAFERSAGDRRRLARVGAVLALLAVLPLTALGYVTSTVAEDTLRGEVDARLRTTVTVSGGVIERELTAVADLVDAYAQRQLLAAPLSARERGAVTRVAITRHLEDFKEVREGLAGVFVADLEGRLIDVVPATPSILGRSFAHRDWYQGLKRTGRTYISSAYKSAVAGEPLVVGVSTYVRDATGRPVAILAAILDLTAIQTYADELASAQHVALTVTDARGTVIARPGGAGPGLQRSSDALVTAALEGKEGVTSRDVGGRSVLAAYARDPALGWSIVAEVPRDAALGGAERIGSVVLAPSSC
jgi:hypothetical protein